MPATDLAHPEEDRALSVEEYARIQMFPDTWKFAGKMSDIYKQTWSKQHKQIQGK